MKLHITTNNFHDTLIELSQQIPYETIEKQKNEVHVLNEMGRGKLSAHSLRDGFELFSVNDVQYKENINVNFTCDPENNFLGLMLITSGNPLWRFKNSDLTQDEISKGAILGTGIDHKELILPSNGNASFYNILIKKDFFNSSIASLQNSNQDVLYEILEQKSTKKFIHLPELTAEMRTALHQISNNQYEGMLKNIFLESKILEVITLFLSQTVNHQSPKKFRKSDVDRIYEAQQILQKDIENPPSVLKLARTVGLNETKLRQGFKHFFNTTVYDYLRKIRMKEARILLLEKQLNVSEAGVAVGYSNISHFARAFKQEFGMNPGEILKYN